MGQTSFRLEEGFKSQVGIPRKTTQREEYESLEKVNRPLLPVGWHVYKGKMGNLERPDIRGP